MIFSVFFPYLCAQLVKPRFAFPYAISAQDYAFCTRKDVSIINQCNLSRMSTDSNHALQVKIGFDVICVSLHKLPPTKMDCLGIQV